MTMIRLRRALPTSRRGNYFRPYRQRAGLRKRLPQRQHETMLNCSSEGGRALSLRYYLFSVRCCRVQVHLSTRPRRIRNELSQTNRMSERWIPARWASEPTDRTQSNATRNWNEMRHRHRNRTNWKTMKRALRLMLCRTLTATPTATATAAGDSLS